MLENNKAHVVKVNVIFLTITLGRVNNYASTELHGF